MDEAGAASRTTLDAMRIALDDAIKAKESEVNAILSPLDDCRSTGRAARHAKADLIAMGTHGRGAIARTLLGSTAESVVRRDSCPVMTVGVAHPHDCTVEAA